MDLDLRRLRYFVTVAEELSFVRAADLLHMTQPALSRQIIALEHDLGFRVFDRDRQGTSLTSGGRQLLEDAIPLLAASAALERRARLAGRGATRFSIGFMPGVDSTPIIREFAARAPYLTIGVIHTALTDQLDFLVDGRVDVCFVRLPLGDDAFATLPLFPEPQVAAVPTAHPVAGRPTIEINQVSGLPLLQDRGEVPEWRGALADPRPWPASDLRRPPTIEEKLERVALGDGVVVLPAGIAGFYRRADISYVPVADVAPRMVALAYSKHRTMPELEEFAKLATSMLGNGGSSEPELSLRRGFWRVFRGGGPIRLRSASGPGHGQGPRQVGGPGSQPWLAGPSVTGAPRVPGASCRAAGGRAWVVIVC